MAIPDDSDWELINAYADGELFAEDRAAIERRLTVDAALAKSLSEIRTLKSHLALLRPPVPGSSPRRMGYARRILRAIRSPIAVAATLAVAITLGAVQLLQLSSEGDWRDFAAKLHRELSANAYILTPATPVAAISTGGMGDLSAFDLSNSRLTLVDVRNANVGGTNVIAMHYRGYNGCSLTIAVTAAREVPSRNPGDGALQAHWTAGSNQYLVVATNMDQTRFDAIAAYARAESLRQKNGTRLRVAVRSATEHAQPCA